MRTRHNCPPHKHRTTRTWGPAAYTAYAWSYCRAQHAEVYVSLEGADGKTVAQFRFRVRARAPRTRAG